MIGIGKLARFRISFLRLRDIRVVYAQSPDCQVDFGKTVVVPLVDVEGDATRAVAGADFHMTDRQGLPGEQVGRRAAVSGRGRGTKKGTGR